MSYLKNFIFGVGLCLISIPACAYYDEPIANPIAGSSWTTDEFVQDAFEAANNGVEVVFPFAPQQVYKIYLQEGFVTDVRLAPDEKLKFVGGGDTVRWKIDTAVTGNAGSGVTHLFIKPMQEGLSTNIVINTDKRVYQLILESGNAYNPMVSWIYPKSDIENFHEETERSYSSIDPTNLKFGYKISNTSYKWSPVDVFRSKNKTYLKMKSDIVNTELPALFAVDDDDKLILISYRFKDGYFIVDRVLDKAVLLSGKKKVTIKYKYED